LLVASFAVEKGTVVGSATGIGGIVGKRLAEGILGMARFPLGAVDQSHGRECRCTLGVQLERPLKVGAGALSIALGDIGGPELNEAVDRIVAICLARETAVGSGHTPGKKTRQ